MTAVAPQATLARGGLVSFGGAAAGSALGLALIVVLGRLLGDAGAGVVLQAIAVLTIALAVARAGMDSTALWILPRLAIDGTAGLRGTTGRLVATAAAAGTLVAVILTIASALLVGPVAEAVVASAWVLPFAAVLAVALAASRALGDLGAYVGIGNVGLPLARVLAVIAAVAVGAGVAGVAAAWAAPAALACAAALWLLALRLRLADAPPHGAAPVGSAPRLARYAAPRVASETLSQALAWLDVVLVGAIAGPAAAGIYGAATRIAAAGTLVDSALRVVVAPRFSGLLHRNDHDGIRALFRTATCWLVLFSAPIYLLLAIFAPVWLGILGRDFAIGAPALAMLSAAAIVTFLAGNVHSVLLMSGRSGLAALNKIVAVAVDVLLLLVLVPLWGITGAAVAWAVAILVDAALATFQVRRILRLPLPLSAGFVPLAIAIGCVGLPAAVSRAVFGATWEGLLIGAALGGICLTICAARAPRLLHLDHFTALLRRTTTGAPS
ncbi:lipopolysaccharide biosynthesis protein [Microbacterium sp. G2-8]|uniref:lipopolysaccharide biosynthesis protein n=1 Tax=Microbacterium sp. G2-8 TaxID=2842454 RepID=UPI001C8A8AAB|nr:polysaccharide biosynthesis C-terminal domain-containing protein [Microbacterium sp. G2-8]